MVTRSRLTVALLSAPALVLFVLLLGVPLIQVTLLSFTEEGSEGTIWTLENYRQNLTGAYFWGSAWRTLLHAGGAVAISTVLGLSAALLIHWPMRMRKAYRVLLLLPWTIPGVVAAMDWKLLFDLRVGPIPYLTESVGLTDETFAWLGSPDFALWAVTIAQGWRAFPFMMLFILAGLQTIDENLLEAASIDGAGAGLKFRHVILPGILPTMLTAAALNFVLTARYFDLIFVMTGGGPLDATEVEAIAVYRNAFLFFTPANAAAIALLMGLLLLVGYLMLRAIRRASTSKARTKTNSVGAAK